MAMATWTRPTTLLGGRTRPATAEIRPATTRGATTSVSPGLVREVALRSMGERFPSRPALFLRSLDLPPSKRGGGVRQWTSSQRTSEPIEAKSAVFARFNYRITAVVV